MLSKWKPHQVSIFTPVLHEPGIRGRMRFVVFVRRSSETRSSLSDVARLRAIAARGLFNMVGESRKRRVRAGGDPGGPAGIRVPIVTGPSRLCRAPRRRECRKRVVNGPPLDVRQVDGG